MTVDFPDRALRRLHEPYRERLGEAYNRYQLDRTAENRAEYRKALKAFADLVLRYEPPLESDHLAGPEGRMRCAERACPAGEAHQPELVPAFFALIVHVTVTIHAAVVLVVQS